jgi:hypothetical protein
VKFGGLQQKDPSVDYLSDCDKNIRTGKGEGQQEKQVTFI